MPGPISSNSTAQYLETTFQDAYAQRERDDTDTFGSLFDVFAVDLPTPRYAYHLTAPYPQRWRRGDERTRAAFKSVTWTTPTVDWSVEIAWHKNDEQDDQLQGVVRKAREGGEHWASLNARVGTQIIENSTDSTLLASVPNAPDGAAFFATTDGDGANRFGVSSGNLLTGSGVGTGAAIRNDLFAGIEQAMQFQDTEGQPLWEPSMVSRGILVMYPVPLMREFAEAFIQSRTVQIVQNVGATENVATAAVTNLVLESGLSLTLFANPRLSDTSDWYMFFKGSPIKPIYRQDRQPLQSHIQDESTSDEARRTGIRSLMWDARAGFGLGPTYQSIKINN